MGRRKPQHSRSAIFSRFLEKRVKHEDLISEQNINNLSLHTLGSTTYNLIEPADSELIENLKKNSSFIASKGNSIPA